MKLFVKCGNSWLSNVMPNFLVIGVREAEQSAAVASADNVYRVPLIVLRTTRMTALAPSQPRGGLAFLFEHSTLNFNLA